MNCCLQNYATHQFTYFTYYSSQEKFKIQELSKSNKYIKSYQENMIEFWIIYFYIFHLNLKLKLDFQVNP